MPIWRLTGGSREARACVSHRLRQRLRDRSAARRAAGRPQLARKNALRPLRRTALAARPLPRRARRTNAVGSTASARPSRIGATSAKIDIGLWRTAPRASKPSSRIAPLRWDPIPIPDETLSFLQGVRTMTTAGDAGTQAGMGAHVYLITRSMQDEYFYNADGELLFVPAAGRTAALRPSSASSTSSPARSPSSRAA